MTLQKTLYQSTVCVFNDKIYSEKLTCGRMYGNFQSKLLRAVLVNTTPIPQFMPVKMLRGQKDSNTGHSAFLLKTPIILIVFMKTGMC